MGSTYDYGHYGVLMKNNIRARWFEAMVRNRDDIVAIDSAVILHPSVWEASGHVGGFSDPLIDCRTCKLRFRADKLEDSNCGRKPSKRPGETTDCDLTEPRQFNLMFETTSARCRRRASRAYLRPGDGAGDLRQLQERAADRAPEAAVRNRADRQVVPQRDHAGQLHLPRRASSSRWRSSSSCRPGRRAVVPLLDRRAAATGTGVGLRDEQAAGPRARPRGAVALLTGHERHRVRAIRSAGPSSRASRTAATSTCAAHGAPTTKLEYVGQDGERYVPYVIEPAVSIERIHARAAVDAYDEEVVGEREKRTVLRPHPRIAPVKAPCCHWSEERRHGRESATSRRSCAAPLRRRVRRERRDRPPLSPPGRDRHAVGVHDRRPDARGRHDHVPRPRLARAGAIPLAGARAWLDDALDRDWVSPKTD